MSALTRLEGVNKHRPKREGRGLSSLPNLAPRLPGDRRSGVSDVGRSLVGMRGGDL